MPSREMQAFLDASPDKGGPDRRPIEEQRRSLDAFMSTYPLPEGIREADCEVGGCPGQKYTPIDGAIDRGVLYLHGGGYTVGSVAGWRGFLGHLARHIDGVVMAIDYRLAPEHPYPAAVKDSVGAFLEIAHYMGHDRLMIAGDSAGGGLALATMLALKQIGADQPACATLLSPATDLTDAGGAARFEADDHQAKSKLYAAETPPHNPGISPIYGDLAGLPPLLIHVAKDEAMFPDSTRLADRATSAGVSVDLHAFDDAFHVFQIFTDLPESGEALAEIGRFFRTKIPMGGD